MAWIESHQALSRHHKTLTLVAQLRCDRYKIIGHLHELWWWGLDNADIDGTIGYVSDEMLAEASGWPLKRASEWVAALKTAGFLDETEHGLALHDWYDYAGKINQRREDNKERMRRARASRQPNPPSNGDIRAQHVLRTNAARAPATGPDRTGPHRTPNGVPAAAARENTEQLVGAFYQAIGVKPNDLTRTRLKRELAIASELIESGATVVEATRFVSWCRAGPYRPVPSDLRVYEQKRAQFLANLEPVAASPPPRNGRLSDADERKAMAEKFAHLGLTS